MIRTFKEVPCKACSRDLLQAYREQQHLINSQQRQIFYLKSSTLWREHQAQQELIEEQKKEIEKLKLELEKKVGSEISSDLHKNQTEQFHASTEWQKPKKQEPKLTVLCMSTRKF